MKVLKLFFKEIRNNIKTIKILKNPKYEKNRIAGELIRNVHSIEKGLVIANPRMGFGHKKQESMLKEIELLKNSESEYHQETIKMAVDVLNEYIKFHTEKDFSDEFILKMNEYLKNYESINQNTSLFGGTKTISKAEMNFDINEIEKFFNTRHSIRDFDDSEVNLKIIEKAIKLAQRAPSACNRQAVRYYVFGKDKLENMKDWLEGMGGFEDSANKYILITAKLSSYRETEEYQYIVSSSIYAAYLSLTLHLYGLGSCFIQRPVVYSKKWDILRKKWNIPEDEQIICLFAVGNLKQTYKVPISHRLENNEMINFL